MWVTRNSCKILRVNAKQQILFDLQQQINFLTKPQYICSFFLKLLRSPLDPTLWPFPPPALPPQTKTTLPLQKRTPPLRKTTLPLRKTTPPLQPPPPPRVCRAPSCASCPGCARPPCPPCSPPADTPPRSSHRRPRSPGRQPAARSSPASSAAPGRSSRCRRPLPRPLTSPGQGT